jgi:hypothetical protein
MPGAGSFAREAAPQVLALSGFPSLRARLESRAKSVKQYRISGDALFRHGVCASRDVEGNDPV